MPPIATSAVSFKPRGELARDEGAQKPIGKDSPVIQPNLEIVGRSLDHHRRLETRLTHFFDGIRADVVYQAERMRALRPHEDVSAASIPSPQPSDALADLFDTPVHSCSAHQSVSAAWRMTRQAPSARVVDNSADTVWYGTILFEAGLPEFPTTLPPFIEWLPCHTIH